MQVCVWENATAPRLSLRAAVRSANRQARERLAGRVPQDPRDEWRPNIYRVATYEKLRRAGNMAFTGCAQTGDVSAATFWPGLPGNNAPSFNVCGD